MPSTSATPAASSGPASTHASSVIPGQELKVPVPYNITDTLLTQGTCYRVLDPLTIRFRSEAGVPPITDDARQREIASTIWQRLASIVPKRSYAVEIVMGIIFDQEAVLPDTFAVIDLVCGTVESCFAIQRELRELHISDKYGRISIFKQDSWRPSIPPNILPFDIWQWWVRHGEVGKLVAQLEQMAAPLGTLISSVRFMLTTSLLAEPDKFYRVLRGHIMLSPETLQLSREEIMDRRPSMFQNNNRISWSECHLDYYKEWARQHPDRAARYEEPDEVAVARQQAREKADASAAAASKKRKANS